MCSGGGSVQPPATLTAGQQIRVANAESANRRAELRLQAELARVASDAQNRHNLLVQQQQQAAAANAAAALAQTTRSNNQRVADLETRENRREYDRARRLEDQRVQNNQLIANANNTSFQNSLRSAGSTARTAAETAIRGRGLVWDDYDDLIDAEINRITRTAPSSTTDFNALFSANLADTVLNNRQDALRTQYTNAINAFAPAGFENTAWATTEDDTIINDILNSEAALMTSGLTRAQSRGLLTSAGHTAATAQLARDRQAANSRLQQLGEGVIGRYRTALTTEADRGRTAARNYTLGSTFDAASYNTAINTLLSNQEDLLEDDIVAAIGDTPLFDLSSILTAAGSAQGPISGTVSSQIGTIIDDGETDDDTSTSSDDEEEDDDSNAKRRLPARNTLF